jgi:hypothetical protein
MPVLTITAASMVFLHTLLSLDYHLSFVVIDRARR